MTLVLENGHDHKDDLIFSAVQSNMQVNVEKLVRAYGTVFRTDADGLFDLYLDVISEGDSDKRRYHDCSTCRDYIKKVGNLVVVNDAGALISINWSWATSDIGIYGPALVALNKKVSGAKIVSAYYTNKEMIGEREAGGWRHFSWEVPSSVFGKVVLDPEPSKRIANVTQRLKTVRHAMTAIKTSTLDEALRVLNGDHVNRSDHYKAPVLWLRDLYDLPKGPAGSNLFWREVSRVPEGYCHPRAGVIATLLEDIESGMDFSKISRRFNIKVDPLYYQRAQAAPSAGTIATAEKLVEKLGVQRSFERRYARLDEVRKIWEQEKEQKPVNQGGMFSHLQVKDDVTKPPITLPSRTMTWEKFASTILPSAKKIEIKTPLYGSFTGVTTAVHADAPPIFKWDFEENRNPISSYVHHNGSHASTWGLVGNAWTNVPAIASLPSSTPFVDERSLLIVEGAKDLAMLNGHVKGNALFSETMKNEFHEIRSVVEAYSKNAEILGHEEASANGLPVGKGDLNYNLRVFHNGGWSNYLIDRYE